MFSNPIVLNLLDFLDKNIYRKVTIQELSDHFHYNKDYLMRIFKREIGTTIIDYMNYERIYSSLESLKDFSISILHISLNYGFYSQEYYSEIFHKIIGVSPSCYRQYLARDNNVSENDYYHIQNQIIFLYDFFRKIKKYKENIPSKNSVISLSIFK